MASKKRDLEIVYNLVWKNRPLNADDRSFIVGMYDIPATTLTWENFKAYLLKNSGSSSADVKVSYFDSDNTEIPIESQTDFQLAMYSFRKRARSGDIITLKLDKNTGSKKKDSNPKYWPQETPVLAEEMAENETPPEWFLKYMKKFKRDLTDEMSGMITKNLTRIAFGSQPVAARKAKVETQKKTRKHTSAPIPGAHQNYDDLKKFAKFERKLEKLEQKSMKLNSKRNDLKSSLAPDSAHISLKNRLIGLQPTKTELLMNASLIEPHVSNTPHMFGGEAYLQSWRVVNTGNLTWSEKTELRFAWGSESLNPINKKVSCPHLFPGEEGTVSVILDIPATPGNYECYWHFYHEGIRFGHWLGCQVIVDESPFTKLPLHEPPTESVQITPLQDEVDVPIELFKEMTVVDNATAEVTTAVTTEQAVNNLDGDRQSVHSYSENSSVSSHSNDGFVLLSMEKENKSDEQGNAEATDVEVKPSNLSTEEVVNEPEENIEREISVDDNFMPEYAYIYYNGEKYPFHKKFLKAEYFNQAEKVPPKAEKTVVSAPSCSPDSTTKSMETKRPSRSTSESSGGSRLFVFPQYSPGFEVVYPEGFHSLDSECTQHQTTEQTQMSSSVNSTSVNAGSQPDRSYSPSFSYCSFYDTQEYACCKSECQPCDFHNPMTPPKSPTVNSQCSTADAQSSDEASKPASEHSQSHGRRHVHRPHVWAARPDNIITGAAILASSAMSTARNMMNMVVENAGGRWVNGHWVVDNPNTKRENGLKQLAEMGFVDRNLNATLMARYNDDVHRVISELVQ